MDKHAPRAFVASPKLLASSAILLISMGLIGFGPNRFAYGQDKGAAKPDPSAKTDQPAKTDPAPKTDSQQQAEQPKPEQKADYPSVSYPEYRRLEEFYDVMLQARVTWETVRNFASTDKEKKAGKGEYDVAVENLQTEEVKFLGKYEPALANEYQHYEDARIKSAAFKEANINTKKDKAYEERSKQISDELNSSWKGLLEAAKPFMQRLEDKMGAQILKDMGVTKEGVPKESKKEDGTKESKEEGAPKDSKKTTSMIPGTGIGNPAVTPTGEAASPGGATSFPTYASTAPASGQLGGNSGFAYTPNWGMSTWPMSFDGIILCTFFHATPYPITFSPSDSAGTPLMPSTNYWGQSTDYGGRTIAPYNWYIGQSLGGYGYPAVPPTQSNSTVPTTPFKDDLKKLDYNFNFPNLVQDSTTRNWGIKYDLPTGWKPGESIEKPVGGAATPIINQPPINSNTPPVPGGGVGSGTPLSILNPADTNDTITPSVTPDIPPPSPSGGVTTYYFKGFEIKIETGTAEQGQTLSLDTQPFRIKLTWLPYELPYGASYLNNPQSWEALRRNYWLGGGPLETAVKPGETSTIQTATNDRILGLPRETGGSNLFYSSNVDNPSIYGYIVAPQPGQLPNFNSQIRDNIVGLGYFYPHMGPSVIWRDPSDNLKAWSYLPANNSWGYTPNFTGGTMAPGDFKIETRYDIIPKSSFGLRYFQLEEPLKLNDRTFFPAYGVNYDPGPKLQQQFGNNLLTNFCWFTLPGPWEEPVNASYAPGADLPGANITLRRLAPSSRANR